MPICPGCEREVSYDQLDIHVQHCPYLNGGNVIAMAAIEQLDRRLSTVEESLQYRIQQLETDRNPPLSRTRRSTSRSSDRSNKS
jgi:hypothetical protein